MSKLAHIFWSLEVGGVEQGVLTLLEEGFYSSMDTSFIEIFKGQGHLRQRIIERLGPDKVITLADRTTHTNQIDEFYRLKRAKLPLLAADMHGSFAALKPDTVLCSGLIPRALATVAALPYPQIKLVSFEHDTAILSPRQKLISRLLSLRGDAVLGDTPETLRRRLPAYIGAPPSHYVPMTLLHPQKPRQRHHGKKIKILSLGRLSEEKNYGALVEAAALLLKEGVKLELTIAGEGKQRAEIEKLIACHTIANHIHLPGHVPHGLATQALLKKADIYVQCSKFEGFCISTAEAMAAGLPVLATDFAGLRDYGTPANHRLIPGTSASDIATSLREMIAHFDEEAPSMSAAALATAEEKFSPGAVHFQWHGAQKELMSPRINKPRMPKNDPRHHPHDAVPA